MKDSHLKIFQLVAVQMESRPKTLQIRNIQSESGKNIFSILTILLSRLKVNWNWWEWIVHKHLLTVQNNWSTVSPSSKQNWTIHLTMWLWSLLPVFGVQLSE